MNYQTIEQELAELPLYIYAWVNPQSLEFSDRVRHICQTECAMYGKSWACPPGVGTVADCRAKCLSYNKALLISSLTEVADIADLEATLATRRDHERLTDQVGDILRAHGLDPYILSTEAWCHLRPLRHSGWQALPPSGKNASLCGKPGHQHHSYAGGERTGVPVRAECGHLGVAAAV